MKIVLFSWRVGTCCEKRRGCEKSHMTDDNDKGIRANNLLSRYLDFLKRVRHHGDEHVNQYDDGHCVVDHEKVFTDDLRKGLHVSLSDRTQLCKPEERPEQGHIAFEETAYIQSKTNMLCQLELFTSGTWPPKRLHSLLYLRRSFTQNWEHSLSTNPTYFSSPPYLSRRYNSKYHSPLLSTCLDLYLELI